MQKYRSQLVGQRQRAGLRGLGEPRRTDGHSGLLCQQAAIVDGFPTDEKDMGHPTKPMTIISNAVLIIRTKRTVRPTTTAGSEAR